jgi:hypothetical protein
MPYAFGRDDTTRTRDRTEDFAVAVVIFCRELRREPGARDIADRSVTRNIDLVKLSGGLPGTLAPGIHLQTCDCAKRTIGWFRIIVRAGLASGDAVEALKREASEIVAILGASGAAENRGDRR